MDDKERELLIEHMKKTAERCKVDRKFARQVLYATGMYTKKGKLKKRFQ